MKTFGKIIICIIVVVAAIGVAYLVYNGDEKATNGNAIANTNTATNSQNINNDITENTTNEIDTENTDYIGEEENKENEPVQEQEPENSQETLEPEQKEEQVELTGKDKAIDIVKKQYALDGQTVRFDHMEGSDYVIKLNDGTAVIWYLVDGTTWEAKEY